MDRNGTSQTHKSIKGHTLTRSLAVVGDDDGLATPKEDPSESADSDELLPFIKETLNKNVKDRNLILRTEAELLQFISSQSQSLPLPGPYSSYQRLLIHRVAAYFQLEHNIDNSGSGIIISRGERAPLADGQRVKFRDLILTNLSHEEAQKKQRKHIHPHNQAPPQWTLAPQQRILKVASFDDGRAQPPPHVAKAFSFGGYPRHHNSNALHKTPNTLSAEASLSPASSGYKSTSFPSMELTRTPSPAGPPYFPTSEEPNNGATQQQQQQQHLPPAAITPNNVSSQPQELVLWAVSDIKSVPPGALLIDPATLSPLRYAGQDEGQQQNYYQPIPPPQQTYYPPPPPIQHQPTYNYYEHVGDIGHWLAGLSLNPQQQQYYAQHSQPLPPQHHQQHPGLYYPQPLSYYPQQPRLPQAAGVTGPPLRFYFPQPTNPPFLLPSPQHQQSLAQQYSPKTLLPQEYAQTAPNQSLPLQPQQQQPLVQRWSYNGQLMGEGNNPRTQGHHGGQGQGMNRQPKHNNHHHRH